MGHNWSWCWLMVVELGLQFIAVHCTIVYFFRYSKLSITQKVKKKKKPGVKNEYYEYKYKNIQGFELVKQGQ